MKDREEEKTHLFERQTLRFGDEQVDVEPPKHKRAEEDEQNQRADVYRDLGREEPKQEVPDPVYNVPPMLSVRLFRRHHGKKEGGKRNKIK